MNENTSGRSRRAVLKGAAVGGAAIAVSGVLPPGAASATSRGPASQVPGIATQIDASHATPGLATWMSSYFRAKSRADVDATMAHFARHPFTYIDATIGSAFPTWDSLYGLFAAFMPAWPDGSASYPVRIIGDTRSAAVLFTNTAGLFGPSESRSFGVVNFDGGRATRWVDYWDGRHFGVANLNAVKRPDADFPADFEEATVGETAAPALRRVVARLAAALAANDSAAAAALFSPDASFEDVPGHVQVAGPRSIGDLLRTAGTSLPYAGPGTAVRHVVGSAAGGGYEWTAGGVVPRGFTALELDGSARITRLTAMWDGARVTDDRLLAIAGAAVER